MKNPSSRLIATGRNFSRHLEENYGVSFTEHDYLVNGLLFDNYTIPANQRCTFTDIQRIVPELSSESKIIFSWGRLSQAKGFYELLLAWDAIANDYPDYCLIIQAPTSCIEESIYFEKFKRKVESVQRAYHIDDFSSKIWQNFLRYDKTGVVCLASTMDPNPHTPIEAKLFGKDMNYVILASFKDGIKDSFSIGECVPLDDPYDIKDFSKKLITAINLAPKHKREMAQKNYESAFTFSYKKNLLEFLQKEGVIV
jgi:glycosyltransferase involved in cell wall biosynthesis